MDVRDSPSLWYGKSESDNIVLSKRNSDDHETKQALDDRVHRMGMHHNNDYISMGTCDPDY